MMNLAACEGGGVEQAGLVTSASSFATKGLPPNCISVLELYHVALSHVISDHELLHLSVLAQHLTQ
jgi:hypothetical protein